MARSQSLSIAPSSSGVSQGSLSSRKLNKTTSLSDLKGALPPVSPKGPKWLRKLRSRDDGLDFRCATVDDKFDAVDEESEMMDPDLTLRLRTSLPPTPQTAPPTSITTASYFSLYTPPASPFTHSASASPAPPSPAALPTPPNSSSDHSPVDSRRDALAEEERLAEQACLSYMSSMRGVPPRTSSRNALMTTSGCDDFGLRSRSESSSSLDSSPSSNSRPRTNESLPSSIGDDVVDPKLSSLPYIDYRRPSLVDIVTFTPSSEAQASPRKYSFV